MEGRVESGRLSSIGTMPENFLKSKPWDEEAPKMLSLLACLTDEGSHISSQTVMCVQPIMRGMNGWI